MGWVANNKDCNDNDRNIHPGSVEVCNGIDDNCNGVIPSNEHDADGDSYMICEGDSNDTNEYIYPSRNEICGNCVDENCDGKIDEEGSIVYEICDNGVDDNRNGQIDEEFDSNGNRMCVPHKCGVGCSSTNTNSLAVTLILFLLISISIRMICTKENVFACGRKCKN